MKKYYSLLFVVISVLYLLYSCSKGEDTIYNNYYGNSSDSTGYYNVFYHDFNPDIVIDTGLISTLLGEYTLDLNNDNEDDLKIRKVNNVLSLESVGVSSGFGGAPAYILLNSFANTSCTPSTIAELPDTMLLQKTMDPNKYQWGVNYRSFNVTNNETTLNGTCSLFGKDVKTGFICTENEMRLGNNYGWLRFSVSSDGTSITLKEYGINLIQGLPIRVGSK